MFEIVVVIVFCWLFFKAVNLAFRMAWGLAKAVASIIFAIALPTMIICLVVAGGALLLVPTALVGIGLILLCICI